MFVTSIKEINRLISIYWKDTIEKNWRPYQKFTLLSLKKLSQGQFFGSTNSSRYHWILKLVAT